jgi:hypothetical protein
VPTQPKKNEHLLFPDKQAAKGLKSFESTIPNDITILAECEHSPPLSLFTPLALKHICNSWNLKYIKLSMGPHKNTRIVKATMDQDQDVQGFCASS